MITWLVAELRSYKLDGDTPLDRAAGLCHFAQRASQPYGLFNLIVSAISWQLILAM